MHVPLEQVRPESQVLPAQQSLPACPHGRQTLSDAHTSPGFAIRASAAALSPGAARGAAPIIGVAPQPRVAHSVGTAFLPQRATLVYRRGHLSGPVPRVVIRVENIALTFEPPSGFGEC